MLGQHTSTDISMETAEMHASLVADDTDDRSRLIKLIVSPRFRSRSRIKELLRCVAGSAKKSPVINDLFVTAEVIQEYNTDGLDCARETQCLRNFATPCFINGAACGTRSYRTAIVSVYVYRIA